MLQNRFQKSLKVDFQNSAPFTKLFKTRFKLPRLLFIDIGNLEKRHHLDTSAYPKWKCKWQRKIPWTEMATDFHFSFLPIASAVPRHCVKRESRKYPASRCTTTLQRNALRRLDLGAHLLVAHRALHFTISRDDQLGRVYRFSGRRRRRQRTARRRLEVAVRSSRRRTTATGVRR